MFRKPRILVLGAGVSGLSTAILLKKKSYEVLIWAKELPPHTTSNKAGAIWHPYFAFPTNKVVPWSRATFEYFQKEIIHDPTSGCFFKKTIQIFDKPQKDPWWKEGFPGTIERPLKKELPSGYIDGYRIGSVIMDTTFYMEYLVKTLKGLGGKILQKEIKHIQESFQEHDVIVNCTGLGSRKLFNDVTLYPIRGQIVRISGIDCEEAIIDDDGPNCPAIVIPRRNDIVLGGTAQFNNWSTEIDPVDTQVILKRIKAIRPSLRNSKIIGESVGLRPARDLIRLESETFGKKTVIHNYGHGGSGFTLSWGCAQEVVDIIEAL